MFTLSNNLNNVNLEIWETSYHFMGVLQSVWSHGFLQFTICVWALRYLVELVRREITLAICKILIKIRNKDIQLSPALPPLGFFKNISRQLYSVLSFVNCLTESSISFIALINEKLKYFLKVLEYAYENASYFIDMCFTHFNTAQVHQKSSTCCTRNRVKY